jgi:acetolactate synthase I/II/III large subunit
MPLLAVCQLSDPISFVTRAKPVLALEAKDSYHSCVKGIMPVSTKGSVVATTSELNVAQLLVECIENEGVEYIFGLPGEENIHIIDALRDSSIRFILVRSEQGGSFMADIYGRLSGKAGVCLATLGPGAINLLLGVADAQLDSSPLVAISAQAGLNRIFKESHQSIDLVGLFRTTTKWADTITIPGATPEMVRKAFKVAQSERPGATALIVPEDVEKLKASGKPLPLNWPRGEAPSAEQVTRAVEVLDDARTPVILAGHGASRRHAAEALIRFSERLRIPVATTFMGKGVFPEDHSNALGTIGFMRHDYGNFGFDQADVVITVGYDLVEYPPDRWNPNGDKRIVHMHHTVAEVDAHYSLAVGVEGNIPDTLDAVAAAATPKDRGQKLNARIRELLQTEMEEGRTDDSFPLKPQRIVADIRAAMGESDIVLADTGAIKMWMARLYRCYRPETCLVSNGLATMAFSLPGALGAKLAYPERKVLAAMGDGSFLMNSQELETAMREKIHFVVLVWVDEHYGLIKWKQELELGHPTFVKFTNPDFMKQAESYGAKGYKIEAADELLPTLRQALEEEVVSIIACPVDYSENLKLTDKLGELTHPV